MRTGWWQGALGIALTLTTFHPKWLAAQTSGADSVERLLARASQAKRLGQPNAALTYSRLARSLARRDEFRRGEAEALLVIGATFHDLGPNDSALTNLRAAQDAFWRLSDTISFVTATTYLAAVHLRSGRPDTALAFNHLAESLADRIGDGHLLGRVGIQIGEAFQRLGQPDSALRHLIQAETILRQLHDSAEQATALSRLGEVHYRVGRHADSARVLLQQALKVAGTTKAEAEAREVLAVIERGQGHPNVALDHLRLALGLRRTRSDSGGIARCHHLLGLVYQALGRRDSAAIHLALALSLQRRLGDRAGEGSTQLSFGSLFLEVNRFDSAFTYTEAALTIAQQGRDALTVADALPQLASIYQNVGNDAEALSWYRRAITAANATQNLALKANVLRMMGRYYENMDEARYALDSYRQALAIASELDATEIEARAFVDMGRAFTVMYEPDSAIASFEKALVVARRGADPRVEVRALTGLAYSWHRLLASPDVVRALEYYESASAVATTVRRGGGGDQDRVDLAEVESQRYEQWALAWLAHPRLSSDDAAWASLAAAERGRSQALLDLRLGSAQPREVSGAMSAEGRQLARRVTEHGAAMLSYLATKDTLLIWIALPNTPIRVVRRPMRRVDVDVQIAALRASLWADSARQAPVSVADARERDAAVIVAQAIDALTARGAGTLLKDISALLLPPELFQGLRPGAEIVVVPHGVLGLVPFSALPVGGLGSLAEAQHPVRFTPSLGLLSYSRAARQASSSTSGAQSALVVGNPAMPMDPDEPGVRLPRLEQSESEAVAVGAFLKVRPLLGAAATESAVRRSMSSASVVHLATHGRAYNSRAQARSSFVALAPSAENPDGLLTVADILEDPRLTLDHTALVVLSACQTGLGNLTEAEGTIGLQRAFLARGAQSVLISLWSVPDTATGHLMRAFYSHWLSKPGSVTKSEALRVAQVELSGIPQFKHPFYWSGFQLVGAP